MTKIIGIVGLGRMGTASVKRFLEKGYHVVGHERRPEVAEELRSMGVEIRQDSKDVAQRSKTVIVFVLNDQQVIEVVTGPDGLLVACDPDSTIICMSTINRDNLEWVAAQCQEKGVPFIDCPCTGGPARVEAGTLTMIAAAPQEILEASRPVLETLGKIVYVGERPGMGQAVKHCNQLLVGTTHAAVMEVITMARRSGLDPRLVCEVIGSGIAGSDYFRLLAASVLDRKPAPGGLGQMCKDMDIVVHSGRHLKLPLYVATAAYHYFLAAQSLGMEDQEASELIRVVERISTSDSSKAEGGS
jgi:3-hydroxyisobutyrate dehydrogenase-like beta-hydroxyacid dehydrogenase